MKGIAADDANRVFAAGTRRVRAALAPLAERRQHATEKPTAEPGEAGREQPLRYVFVVAYGRSGSTLLQGVLNSIPGYLVRGENHAAAYRLFKYHQNCVKGKREIARASTDERHPWFGIDGYPERRALAGFRRLLLDTVIRPSPDSRVVGFKEIRWGQEDLQKYVEFLQRVFPGAKFVFNTRDHAAVAASKWWRDRPDARERLEYAEALHRRVSESLGQAAFRVHYDDYLADPGTLRGLFDWLGEDFDEESVRAVFGRRHSF